MTPSQRSIVRDETGAAMAEAMICFPVFAAVLAGIVAIHGMYASKLEAKARARRLAWLQADSGQCPPTTCRNRECALVERDVRASGLEGALGVNDGRFSLASFLGDVGRYLLGTTTHGLGTARAKMPSTVAARLGSKRGTTTLLCNTSPRHSDSGISVLEHACRTDLGATEYAREACR